MLVISITNFRDQLRETLAACMSFESRQTPEGWWIVAVPFFRIQKRFAVVSPYGLERRRFLCRASAEKFARQCHAAGQGRTSALGRWASRPCPPRRIRPLGRWMVGTETYNGGSTNYVVASPDGVFMDEFAFRDEAEAYAQKCRQAERLRLNRG